MTINNTETAELRNSPEKLTLPDAVIQFVNKADATMNESMVLTEINMVARGGDEYKLAEKILKERAQLKAILLRNLENTDISNKVFELMIDIVGEEKLEKDLYIHLKIVANGASDDKLIEFVKSNKTKLKALVLELLKYEEINTLALRKAFEAMGENIVMEELYAQLGKEYKLGGHSETATDCVQILRQSPTFEKMVDNNPIRYFSEGSDLVLSENLGKVTNIVDRGNFNKLREYEPTNNKLYVFALVKPPLRMNGKPNVTHLQIPTALQSDPRKLAIIHASADHGKVIIEPDIVDYLSGKKFERVYVIEIDLNNPYTKTQSEREPLFLKPGYPGGAYERPQAYDIPIIVDKFKLIHPGKEVEIDPEERGALEMISSNRVLSYITILTGIREGKLGHTNNIMEELAYRTYANPEEHSLGLHQLTSVVAKVFDKWIGTINKQKAKALGIQRLWKDKKEGGEITWKDIVPFLTNYDITDKKYTNPTMSTVCA